MKNINKINAFLTVALLLLGTSCDNSLDEVLYSELAASSYSYPKPEAGIGGAYANLRRFVTVVSTQYVSETTSDDLVMPANASGWDDGGIFKKMHLHTFDAGSTQLRDMWRDYYTVIGFCNMTIDQIQKDIIEFPSATLKDGAIAEMKVLRAYCYWQILDLWGDAPLVTAPTSEIDEVPAATPRKDLYKFVVDDIIAALPLLSTEKTNQNYGHFNKWGAKALLANVYLNAEIYSGTPKWNECINECNDIIASGKYQLSPKFTDPFLTQNESNQENIFVIPLDEVWGKNFNVHFCSWHSVLKGKLNLKTSPYGCGTISGIPQFIDTYDPDDTRFNDSWIYGPQYQYQTNTPLKGTYDKAGQPFVYTKELPNGLYAGEMEGYRMGKFEVLPQTSDHLSNDYPIFRYAQVLLMKAECLLRTGKGDEAATIVSSVRARNFKAKPEKAIVTASTLAGNSKYRYGYVENYKIVSDGDQTPVMYGGMYDELGWEFVWEGFRRRDMIRYGTYTKKSWLSHKPNGDYRKVFPIPQVALDANNKLKQNQGYN